MKKLFRQHKKGDHTIDTSTQPELVIESSDAPAVQESVDNSAGTHELDQCIASLNEGSHADVEIPPTAVERSTIGFVGTFEAENWDVSTSADLYGLDTETVD